MGGFPCRGRLPVLPYPRTPQYSCLEPGAGGEAGPMGIEGVWVGTLWVHVSRLILSGISPVGAGTCMARAGEEERWKDHAGDTCVA